MTNQELDKWLAENVMGWLEYKAKGGLYPGLYWATAFNDCSGGMNQDDWQPTQDIKQTFECVKKCCTKLSLALNFDPQASYHCDKIHRWIACIPENENCVTAKTPTLAICLAIKKAMG
jgi:hypothetical protein